MKTKLHLVFKLLMMSMLSLTLTMCSSDDDGGGDNGGSVNVGGGYTQPTGTVTLSGVITDAEGKVLSGATIKSGLTETTTSDNNGAFTLFAAPVVDKRVTITISKEGFFDATKTSKKEGDFLVINATLQSKSIPTETPSFTATTFEVASGATASVDEAVVGIPSNGLKNAETGAEVTGSAKMEVLYLSTENENFSELMPGGDMAAIDKNDDEVILYSYGMMNVKLTDESDNALQIKEGKKATVTFPIAEDQKADAPATMPLWSFDQEKGVWIEEGVATKSEDGNYYEGEVTHFSWVNLDYPSSRATVEGTVKDADGNPVPGVKVIIDQVMRYTDQNGKYSTFVPIDVNLEIYIKAIDYFGETIAKKNESKLVAGETRTVNFTLPSLPKAVGKVTSCTKTSGEEGIVTLTYTDEFNIRKTYSTVTKDGEFSFTIPNNVNNINVEASRAGRTAIKTKYLTAEEKGTNIDLGNIEVCTPIETGENYIKIGGSTYKFDGETLCHMMTQNYDSVESKMMFFSLESKATKITDSYEQPIYSTSIYIRNITKTGSYTFNPESQEWGTEPFFMVSHVQIDSTWYFMESGVLQITKFGPAGGLVEGKITGVLFAEDYANQNEELEKKNFEIKFSCERGADLTHGVY